jgi:hypothetical protein
MQDGFYFTKCAVAELLEAKFYSCSLLLNCFLTLMERVNPSRLLVEDRKSARCNRHASKDSMCVLFLLLAYHLLFGGAVESFGRIQFL